MMSSTYGKIGVAVVRHVTCPPFQVAVLRELFATVLVNRRLIGLIENAAKS